jgi:hypothetical protein
MATGSYGNLFKVVGARSGSETQLEASRDPLRKRLSTPSKVRGSCSRRRPSARPPVCLIVWLSAWPPTAGILVWLLRSAEARLPACSVCQIQRDNQVRIPERCVCVGGGGASASRGNCHYCRVVSAVKPQELPRVGSGFRLDCKGQDVLSVEAGRGWGHAFLQGAASSLRLHDWHGGWVAQAGGRFGLSRANSGKRSNGATPNGTLPADGEQLAGQDFAAKLLHLAWHPESNVIATAASNSLYVYCAR